MVKYALYYTKQAQKDAKKLSNNEKLKKDGLELLNILMENPYQDPPPYKELIGDLKGAISRRINFQHRLVYQVFEESKAVKIIRMWSHYE